MHDPAPAYPDSLSLDQSMTKPGTNGHTPLSIYIHWPYCLAKCPYCDFNSLASDQYDYNLWEQSYLQSINWYGQILPRRIVKTIFFGGGTPSLMHPDLIAKILSAISQAWPISNDVEITLEANPTSVEIQKFMDFRAAGVNRVSIGIQSLNDKALQFLGRQHNTKEGITAIETAQSIFDSYSFDLIYARPEQTARSWEQELQSALPHTNGHLSVYQLTIERNTPFYGQFHSGKFTLPDDIKGADLYNITQDILDDYGLRSYETSNHAANGHESRHNMNYWNGGEYVGIGPGAHGRLYLDGQWHGFSEHRSIEIWHDLIQSQGYGANRRDPITPNERFQEVIMVGLRKTQGIAHSFIKQEAPTPDDLQQFTNKIIQLEKEGFMERTDYHVKTTRAGRLVLNSILQFLLT